MVTLSNPAPDVPSSVAPQVRDRGYARLPRLFSRAEIDDARSHLNRVISDVLPTMDPNDYVLEPGGGAVRNLWRLEHYDPYFAELGNTPRLLDIIGRLLDGDPQLMPVETFSKPARQASAVPPHQHNAYFCRFPGTS